MGAGKSWCHSQGPASQLGWEEFVHQSGSCISARMGGDGAPVKVLHLSSWEEALLGVRMNLRVKLWEHPRTRCHHLESLAGLSTCERMKKPNRPRQRKSRAQQTKPTTGERFLLGNGERPSAKQAGVTVEAEAHSLRAKGFRGL